MARRLYNHGDQNIVVLKVAQSGTTLTSPPALWTPRTGSLYQRLVNDSHLLEQNEAARGISASVGAVVWYQGEFDATPAAAPHYQAALQQFISDLHPDLGLAVNTPLILVKMEMAYDYYSQLLNGQMDLARWEVWNRANDEVRAADDWASANMPSVYTVDSAGLPRISDTVHLSDLSEMTLGSEIGSKLLAVGTT
jgi:hypothetical protein